MRSVQLAAAEIIRLLGLKPHPEGGHFRETFRDPRAIGRPRRIDRDLLPAGARRALALAPGRCRRGLALLRRQRAALEIAASSHGPIERVTLGPDLAAGERPQAVVPAHAWQAAESLGDWTLVGCTVAPGFEFAGFELAPKGWSPGPRNGVAAAGANVSAAASRSTAGSRMTAARIVTTSVTSSTTSSCAKPDCGRRAPPARSAQTAGPRARSSRSSGRARPPPDAGSAPAAIPPPR